MGRARRIALFLAIAFAGSWAVAAAFWFAFGSWDRPEAQAFAVLYAMGPAIAALIVQGPILKGEILKPFALVLTLNRWMLVAWLLPILIAALTIGFGAALGAPIEGDREHALQFVLQGMLFGVTIGMFVALGEEIGWRGFLLKEVQGGLWRRSLAVGVAWAVWLLPLGSFYHPGAPILGAALLAAWALVLSPALTYLRVRAGTLLAPLIFRGTLRAMTLLPALLVPSADPHAVAVHGGTGIAGALVALVVLLAHDRFVAKDPIATGKRRAVRTDPSPPAAP